MGFNIYKDKASEKPVVKYQIHKIIIPLKVNPLLPGHKRKTINGL
jgi:hypothetical protein